MRLRYARYFPTGIRLPFVRNAVSNVDCLSDPRCVAGITGKRSICTSKSVIANGNAKDTLAMMKQWRREVVSSASMAEWLRAWDTLAMMKEIEARGREFKLGYYNIIIIVSF